MYTTAAEDAKTIREALKAKGWNRNHVSVRARNYAGGSSIDVEILTDVPDYETVKRIAEGKEHVRYCEFSGEILSGGNRFVFVKHGEPVVDVIAAEVSAEAEIDRAATEAKVEPGLCVPLAGRWAWWSVCAQRNGTLSLFGGDRHSAQVWDTASIARQVAYEYLRRKK